MSNQQHNFFARIAIGLLLAIASTLAFADVQYVYDENGRLIGVYAPNGDAAQYVYDPAGNITQINRLNAGTLALLDFSPKKGPVGTSVTIWGNGFSATTAQDAVSFNGASATVVSASTNKIVATVPSGATTGPITVTVSGNSVTSSASFTVTSAVACANRVTGFTPSLAVPGTSVAISGAGFDTGTNIVLFNGVKAPVVSATSTTLTVTVPTGATSGHLVVSLPPSCDPIVAGDFFVPPTGYTASDIGFTARLTLNGSAVTATVAANKKALFVFDANPDQGAGLAFTNSTLGSVNADMRAPDGSVMTTTSFSTTSGTVGPTFFRLTGGFSAFVNPALGTAGSATVQLGGPDLSVTSASLNGTVTENQNGSFTIPVAYTVQNVGAMSATPNWYDYIYLSSGVVLDSSSIVVGNSFRQTAVAPGNTYSVTGTYTLSGVAPGAYNLFVKADSKGTKNADYGYFMEANEINNVSAAVPVTLPSYPDLAITSPSVGTITENQNGSFNIPVTFTVANQGTTTAQPSWIDYGYLSTNGALDASSTTLSGVSRATALTGGSSYTVNKTYLTSGINPGNYTLFLKADGHAGSQAGDNGAVVESNETNNVASFNITLPSYPDLAISNPSVGTITENQNGTFNIPVSFTVTNVGTTPAQPNWVDYGYLSTNGVLDNSSVALAGNVRTTVLNGSASYIVNKTYLTASGTGPGNYTLFFKADGHTGSTTTDNGAVAESNETNNVTSLAITLPSYPDLVISNPSVGTITKNGSTYSIPVSFTVTNQGTTTALASWTDAGYLSRNGVLDSNSTTIGSTARSTSVAGGGSYTVNATYTTSAFTAGTYTLFLKADGQSGLPTSNGVVAESNESNNVTSGISVTLP